MMVPMSDAFGEVAEILFGAGGDELVSKMRSDITKANPAQSDVSTKGGMSDRKRQVTAGLSAVGAAAGAAGLTLGGHNVRRSYVKARQAQKALAWHGFSSRVRRRRRSSTLWATRS